MKLFFDKSWKFITQTNIWHQFFLSLRHQSMKRNSNQRLKRCLEIANVLNDTFCY